MVNSIEAKEDIYEISGLQRLKLRMVTIIGYVLPFLASIPPMLGWAGLMTVPLIFFIIIMGGRFPELPVSIPYLLFGGSILDAFVVIFGIVILISSIIALRREKSKGLVTSNIYRLVRHPQYLGLILFTAGLTSRSVWILMNTFGVGWLNVQETILVWIAVLVVYICLAGIEELHLASTFDVSWSEYRDRVGFLIPLPVRLPRALEILLAIVIPISLLYGLIFFNM
ncbi:MAG: methyltransferase family protein [Candidatus Sifarchaeia archaeon]